MTLRLLLVEREPADAAAIRDLLGQGGQAVELVHVARCAEAAPRLSLRRFDAALVALDGDADFEGLAELRAAFRRLPVVALSRDPGVETAARALRARAHDCLVKAELTAPSLARGIALAIERDRMALEQERAGKPDCGECEFLTNMSHEIRTPMNAIVGMTEILRQGPLTQQQVLDLRHLGTASDHLLALIDDVLDLSRLEGGRLTLESAPFDLRELVRTTTDFLAGGARAKSLALRCRVEPSVPACLRGDARRLRQILTNLVGNAIKFTARGHVEVRVEPDPGDEPGCLRFSVADTGIGIAADHHAMIFERFTQVDPSATRVHGGAGLGLDIARRLVGMMGGRIWVESEPGKGSTFHFTARFDLAAPPEVDGAPEADVAPALAARRHRLRILLADDAVESSWLIGAYLRGIDLDLEAVADGAEALARVRDGRYDLVLMDMQMPVMDGEAATRAIRAWERERGAEPVPIIALTAHSLPAAVRRCTAAGCTTHLAKPVKKAALVEAILRYAAPDDAAREVRPRTLPRIADTVAALLPAYVESRHDDLRAIAAALDRGDFDRIATAGHNMAGSGASYGLPEVSALGRSIYEAARRGDAGAIRRDVERLRDNITRVEGDLRRR